MTNAYYKVPLKTMRVMAEKYAGMTLNADYFKLKNINEGQVGELLNSIPKAVLENVRWNGIPINFSNKYVNLSDFRK